MTVTGQSEKARPGLLAPATFGSDVPLRIRIAEWFDRQSRQFFILPAVVMILVFSIFPLVASLILAFSRVRLRAGSYEIRPVGFANFEKQIFGS
jgi:multiple sugar transport system permease protein